MRKGVNSKVIRIKGEYLFAGVGKLRIRICVFQPKSFEYLDHENVAEK
jgi:hypothetical protein